MKLIVGLGNPGRRYEQTRHNIGFQVVAAVSRSFGGGPPRARFEGHAVDITIGGEKVLLLCPATYMNLSGGSVQPAKDFYKLDNSDLLVVCDDFHLSLGQLRFRAKGSAGGQKGLADIIRRLGTEDFSRLRFGIGTPPEGYNAADYVLGKFAKSESKEVEHAVGCAAEAVTEWVRSGTAYCMNRYN